MAALGGSVVAVSLVASVAQEANNRIKLKLANDRHEAKLHQFRQKSNKQHTISSLQQELTQKQQELIVITNTIEEEEMKMTTFENVNNDENTKFMVALGMTGDGKSTMSNRLYGDESTYGNEGPFEANDSDQSVTQDPQHKEVVINERQTVIVDTPGYKDSGNRDDLHFNNLGEYLYGCGGVDAFLLVMNGAKNRFDANIQEMFKEYRKYFGSNFWKHLIIIFTRIEGFEKDRYNRKAKAEKLSENIRNIMNDFDDMYTVHGYVRVINHGANMIDDIINIIYQFYSIDDVTDECTLPVITIGFGEDFAAFRRDVMNEVERISNSDSKLECKHIQSPIRRLREGKQRLQRRIQQLNDQITSIQQEIDDIDDRIAKLNYKIENPEKWPLFGLF